MANATVRYALGIVAKNALPAAFSASCDHVAEYVGILPLIVPVRKLRQVQRQIFFAYMVKLSHNSALQQTSHNASVFYCGADSVAHIPSGAVVAASDLPVNPKRGHTLLPLRHKVDHFEPSPKRIAGILKNRSGNDGKAIAVFSAAISIIANPVKRARFEFVNFLVITARAMNAVRPAEFLQVLLAIFLCGELLFEFVQRQARLRRFYLAIWIPPRYEEE